MFVLWPHENTNAVLSGLLITILAGCVMRLPRPVALNKSHHEQLESCLLSSKGISVSYLYPRRKLELPDFSCPSQTKIYIPRDISSNATIQRIPRPPRQSM